MRKKRFCFRGDSAYISSIIVIMSFILLVMIYMYFNSAVTHNTEINAIGRKYLMKMETMGYLSADDKKDLMKELTGLPYTSSVSIESDTSTSFVGHHNDLMLHIKVTADDIPFSNITDIFSPEKNGMGRVIEVKKSSSYL